MGEYSGERKEIRPVTLATYQIITTRRGGLYPHLELLSAEDWGLVVYDEVHLLPAPVFRMAADIQSRRRLGLTATLVREDGRAGDVFSLIGPKRYDAPVARHRGPGLDRPRPLRGGAGHPGRRGAHGLRPGRARGALPGGRHRPVEAGRGRGAVPGGRPPGRAHAGDRPVPRPARPAGRAPGRARPQRQDAHRRAGEALRRLPAGRGAGAGRVQGGQLLHRPARGVGGHPGVGHLRQPPGGGAAAGPHPAAQGRRPPGPLLHRRGPRHQRPGVRRPPPAVPGRAGLRLRDRRRRSRPPGRRRPTARPPAGPPTGAAAHRAWPPGPGACPAPAPSCSRPPPDDPGA